MLLNDKTIKDLNLITENFDKSNLQPASYDLTLDLYNGTDAVLEVDEVQGLTCPIAPGETVLVTSKEVVELPNNVGATLKDKSSFARAGLRIAQGWIDPGFEGTLTVVITNVSGVPVWLKNDEPFCQIVFMEVKNPAEKVYNGHYQNQRGVVRSIFNESDESVGCIYGEVSD